MKKYIIFFVTVSLLLVGVMGFIKVDGQNERTAKKTVENYLSAMEKGDQNNAYKYLGFNTDSLIDVFDYKYLNTLENKDLPAKKTTVLRWDFSNNPKLVGQYKTYPKYVDSINNTYGKNKDYIVKEGTNDITFYKKGTTYKQVKFLYDMSIANGAGEKIYKKVEFTMLWDEYKGKDGSFEITNIRIR